MYNFCTLFDSNYLTRGLAMYESLKRHCSNFQLFIFPFDAKCYEVLKSLNLQNVQLISMNEFEDRELLSVKPSRSKGEYCWTSTSSTILYCIKKFNLDHCTYLDADLYFYNSPDILFKEVEGKSVLITEHRYTTKYDRSSDCGKYCVQFVYFKNDENGMKVLEWWRNACINWCYNRQEDGKFGDQKYLDDWTIRFNGVQELQHLGGGVAPWNIQQYEIIQNNPRIKMKDKNSQKDFNLIFYHFHELKYLLTNKFVLVNEYDMVPEVINTLYLPYINHLSDLEKKLLKGFGIFGHEYKKFQFNNYTYNILKRKIRGDIHILLK